MRREMVEALGRIGDERAVDVLIDELGNNDTKMEAMDALGRIGSEEATDELVEMLEPEEEGSGTHVRAKAAETVGQIGDEAAVGALVENLEDESARVRGTAADALARIGVDDEGAVDALADLLEDEPEESVRLSAAKALREIGTEGAREVLTEYENDRNELVANAASGV
ncbi:MAG: HEAT repeat domain-containing protein [Halobacteriales archaeon]|nr:HEAT repeat domain-containing protein [Halobacteriales archaeon]